MPIGENAGGQLNIFLFEVGGVVRLEQFGVVVETTHAFTIHPLLTAPRSVRYRDQSRSPVTFTATGSLMTVSGRGPRRCTIEGTFGVESRGLLWYIGNGDIRFQRLYKEVVRMGEALNQDQIDENVDILNGTPGVSLLVAPYIDGATTMYINWYDFWNNISFHARVVSFEWSREYGKGAAAGQISYRMEIEEVGPLVTGSLAETLISGLLTGLTIWDDINDVIGSYTLDVILGALTAPIGILASEFQDTLDAFNAQVEGVQEIMGANTPTTTSSDTTTEQSTSGAAADFPTTADQAARQADDLGDSVAALRAGAVDSETASIDFGTSGADGNTELGLYDQQAALREVSDGMRAQKVLGVLFGMSREQYQDYITAGGVPSVPAPEVGGSITHCVSDTDTPDSLERAYNVTFARILAVNAMTPDEALVVGTCLQIPQVRARGPQGFAGLPTFGSHVGQSALGIDLPMEITAGTDGDFSTVSGADAIEQGVQFLLETFAEGLLKRVQLVPDKTRVEYLTRNLQELLKSDRRVKAVSGITVEETGGQIDVAVTLQTINGNTVRTGGP